MILFSYLYSRFRICPGATCLLLFLIISAQSTALEAAAQEYQRTDSDRFKDWAYQDAEAWINSWDTQRLAYVAGATAVLAGLSFADQAVSDQAINWGSGTFGGFQDVANEIGGPYGLLIPTSIFALSFASNDTKFQDAAFTSLQSYVYSNVLVFAIKYTVGRSRPDAGKGPHDFHPFSGANSFPSGHTSSAFAMVMPWVFYYPGPVTYALVAVAVGTAIARIQRQRHWFTDVLAGAAISTAMSYYLYGRHRDLQKPSTGLNPVGSGGPSMKFTFKL
jgi:membrane-associated phospholipid phosphatase